MVKYLKHLEIYKLKKKETAGDVSKRACNEYTVSRIKVLHYSVVVSLTFHFSLSEIVHNTHYYYRIPLI